jgi:hypothetical protein
VFSILWFITGCCCCGDVRGGCCCRCRQPLLHAAASLVHCAATPAAVSGGSCCPACQSMTAAAAGPCYCLHGCCSCQHTAERSGLVVIPAFLQDNSRQPPAHCISKCCMWPILLRQLHGSMPAVALITNATQNSTTTACAKQLHLPYRTAVHRHAQLPRLVLAGWQYGCFDQPVTHVA